jgi:hypothetical protein
MYLQVQGRRPPELQRGSQETSKPFRRHAYRCSREGLLLFSSPRIRKIPSSTHLHASRPVSQPCRKRGLKNEPSTRKFRMACIAFTWESELCLINSWVTVARSPTSAILRRASGFCVRLVTAHNAVSFTWGSCVFLLNTPSRERRMSSRRIRSRE